MKFVTLEREYNFCHFETGLGTQGPGLFSTVFPGHSQGVESEMKHLPLQDAGTTSGGLACYTTALALKNQIFFCCLLSRLKFTAKLR